jgi:hypothetical protein
MVYPRRKDLRHNVFAANRRPVTTGQLYGAQPPPGCRPRTSPREPRPTTPTAPDVPPAGAVGPTKTAELQDLERSLADAARHVWLRLPDADVAAAVDAGMLAEAKRTNVADGPMGDRVRSTSGEVVAAATGQAASTVQRQGLPSSAAVLVDWSPFGMVIPVLAGSPGAGASVLAAAIADALQLAGRGTLLVDAADPARSGLAMAARSAGPTVRGPHPSVCIRYSWRGKVLLAQLETWLPVVAPGMVPPPRFWHLGVNVNATVVDVGHDSWRIAAHPITGAGEWLRSGTPTPRTVLVVRPTRPSLRHAEQVLSRLEPWTNAGTAASPTQLVVMGAKRWPQGVAGSAGRRITALISDAVFVPHDAATAVGGVDADVSPARLREAVMPLLRKWGAFGEDHGSTVHGAVKGARS